MSVMAVCAFLLAAMAGVLIAHKEYEDGLIGRIALAGIILGSVIVMLMEFATGSSYEGYVPPEVLVLVVSVVAFMARHLYRFMRFRATGKFSWKEKGKEVHA